MAQDNVSEDHTDNLSVNDSVEQRLTALEEQNKELKAALDQQQKYSLPNITRRQALGSLLGGSVLLGATGTASADSPWEEDEQGEGSPWAPDEHDHSGGYLGESEPVNRIDANVANVSTLAIREKQFVPEIREGEEHVFAQYENYGPIEQGLSLQPGTRFWGSNLLQERDVATTTSMQYETMASFLAPPLYHQPGTLPVVILTGSLSINQEGERIHIRLRCLTREPTPTIPIGMTGGGEFIKEQYLADPFDHYSTGRKKNLPRWILEAKVSGGSGSVDHIRADIVYEVR